MNKDDLQKIIDQLETANSKDEAYFGIFQYGGDPDESFVKANKQGLELFAADLLKASRDADEILAGKERDIIPLDFEEAWIEGDTVIQYIEPILDKRKGGNHERFKETWNDKAARYGCFAAVIVAIVSAIVGLITIVRWIF